MSWLSRPAAMLGSAALVFALALVGAEGASAELVARGIQRGMLALGSNGAPQVAYVRGTRVVISTRAGKARWRPAKAASISAGSRVMAFAVGAKGPVALVQNADARTLVLVRRSGTRWQTIRLAGGLPASTELGWPGLALDSRGLPAVAYTRWNGTNWNSQLLLVRVDSRGRVHSQKVTAEGFPQSYVPPPAAPVFVGKQIHVIESYGFGTVVGTLEWYPEKGTWTGLGLDVVRGDWPVGPMLVGRSAGTVYAAWTQSMMGFDAVPVTLAARAREAKAEFLLNRALTTALALPASGPEVAANEWVGADDLGLDGEGQIWAGQVVSRTSQVELDGWIAGLAAGPRGARDLLLARQAGLSWFRSPRRLTTRMTIDATDRNGSVSVSGSVDGARPGKVTLYRERPGAARQAVGQGSFANGWFSFVDRPSTRPLVYRAVYTDPASGIPYAALSRKPVR